jgi:serine phosphatase RsbU (regulator of sigma subunit)/Tfp pilus assembly protein PilF
LRRFSLSLFLISFGIFRAVFLPAQTAACDSISGLLKSAGQDTNRVLLLNELGKAQINAGTYESARKTADEAKTLSEKLSFPRGIADAWSNMGVAFYYEGNYYEALNANFEALKVREDQKDKKGLAASYNNIAIIYNYQGKYNEALRYLLPSLQLKEELGDRKGSVSTYNNIGLCYYYQKNYGEALRYYKKSLEISNETKNQKGIANANTNIGNVYFDLGQYDTAMPYFSRALRIREELGNKQGIASVLVYIGRIQTKQEKFGAAHASLDRALGLTQEIGEKEGIKNCYEALAVLAFAEGEYKLAYAYNVKSNAIKDSIFNDKSSSEATRIEMNFGFQRKQNAEKAERDREETILREDAKKREQAVYYISGILALAIAVAFFAWRSVRQKQRANHELDVKNRKIEHAYKIIETKNQEITDSINYAWRIQQAILPDNKEVFNVLPDSFILYRPKDIVGGDFYFCTQKNDAVILAVADCTGHGVPGAFMSLIGVKELKLAVEQTFSPGEILQLLNGGVKNTLRQNHEDFAGTEMKMQDGMDIALLRISGNRVAYAGANRPLWIVRESGATIEEIKPTKAAIAGSTPGDQVFSEHALPVFPGDCIYIFTDGFADQFGGGTTPAKKLTTKRMREVLLRVAQKPMSQQEEEIRAAFDEWKGGHEQVDDVLLIGIKIR